MTKKKVEFDIDAYVHSRIEHIRGKGFKFWINDEPVTEETYIQCMEDAIRFDYEEEKRLEQEAIEDSKPVRKSRKK